MIRVRFTAADFARVRFASRPAPLQELHATLGMLLRRDKVLVFGQWRRRLLRSLPDAVRPLRDLVPGQVAPAFLDVFSDSLDEGLHRVRAAPAELVSSELERVYAQHPAAPPAWVRDLHRGDARAWRLLRRAQQAAFDTVVGPVWPLVQDLHRAAFTRYALTAAEQGIDVALTQLVPGTRLHQNVWEFPSLAQPETGLRAANQRKTRPRNTGQRDIDSDRAVQPHSPSHDIELQGRGLILLPTFHWTGQPLIWSVPSHPVVLTYPAGHGLPLQPAEADSTEDALAGVLGRTRTEILLLLEAEHSTSQLARRLGVSNATVSSHTAALRSAGLITTVRAGRSVLHQRTALGGLLLRHPTAHRTPAPPQPSPERP